MSIETLIDQYGYLAIVAGTFFEGETILVIAGFLAHQGYLSLGGVVAAAFTGALLGDQLYFFIGRWKGPGFIAARPALHRRSRKMEKFLRQHQVWFILLFRFIYGVRTVAPFMLGASGVNAGFFLLLNTVGAAIWATAISTAGYYLGRALEITLGRVKDYELVVIGALATAALVYWLLRFAQYRHRRSGNQEETDDV